MRLVDILMYFVLTCVATMIGVCYAMAVETMQRKNYKAFWIYILSILITPVGAWLVAMIVKPSKTLAERVGEHIDENQQAREDQQISESQQASGTQQPPETQPASETDQASGTQPQGDAQPAGEEKKDDHPPENTE